MTRLCLVLATVLVGAALTQTVAADDDAQAETVYRQWLKKIRLIEIQHLRSRSPASWGEGRTKLLAIKDPAAAGPMVDVLYGPNPRYRGLLIEALTAMMGEYSDVAVAYLQEIAVGDGSAAHRNRAVASLKQAPSPGQTNRLLAHLALDDVPIIRDRAATALAALGDKRAVWLLVERLVTEDVRMVGGEVWDGSMQLDIRFQMAGVPRFRAVTVSAAVSDGGVATTQIQLPEVAIVDVATTIAMMQHGTPVPRYERVRTEHPRVLAALKQLTGKNFGYNQAAWQKWLQSEEAKEKVPPWEPVRFKTD